MWIGKGCDDAVVYLRTCYDERAGRNRFGECRAALNRHVVWHTVDLVCTPRCDTPHIVWGRGYDLGPAA